MLDVPDALLPGVKGKVVDQAPVRFSAEGDMRSDAELLAAHQVTCSWPGPYYEKVQQLARMSSQDCIVEVGVAYGYHAQHVLRHNLGTRYSGVDP